MGLASSQARLLSITARLTDNEYRTQRLTNARLKLTDISNAARTQYQDALQSQQFQYMTYDASGDSTNIAFTPAVAWQYQPCKNQYAIVNQAGNIMVSSIDAKNFRETDNLAEFLKRYDCLETFEVTTKTIKQPESTPVQPPVETPSVAPVEDSEQNFDLYDKFLWATGICYASALAGLAEHGVGDYERQIRDSKGNLISEYKEHPNLNYRKAVYYYNELGEEIGGSGQMPHSECYCHVFSHLLALGTWRTTLNDTFEIYEGFDQNTGGAYGHWWDDSGISRKTDSEYFAQLIDSDKEKYVCCGDGGVDITLDDWHYAKLGPEYRSQRAKILMSDYYFDDSGTPKLKSLQQKIVDLDYAMAEHVLTFQEAYDAIEHFVNHDLKGAITHAPQAPVEEPQPAVEEPTVPPEVVETTIEKLTIKDPEKAQWYTNLWYRMNGMDEPERIYKNVEDVVNDRQEEQTYTEYLLKLFDIKKNTFTTCYQELPANLASSKDWLNDALAQGWVTLQKAGVSRTTAKDKFKWSDIIYSNASDITLTQDDNAIAKAEAKYTQALREVNSKDKVFENKIRKLDTEHNALQTEYNSVKAAIDKNVERSFKVFQG